MPEVGSASTGHDVASARRGDDVRRHAAAAAGEDHAALVVEGGQLRTGHAETPSSRAGRGRAPGGGGQRAGRADERFAHRQVEVDRAGVGAVAAAHAGQRAPRCRRRRGRATPGSWNQRTAAPNKRVWSMVCAGAAS